MAGWDDEPSGDTVPPGTTSKGLLVGKKKATGMSKRLGFTDRATINENKDILRFNERLEREARGLPPEEPRRGGPAGRPSRDRPARERPNGERTDAERPGRAGSSRPPRAGRPPRPPALDDEQTAALTAAYRAVVGESGLEAAADRVIARLAAHDGFERATLAGWEVAAGGHAEERTAEQWELLRKAWLAIRMALLEAYAAFTPAAAEALARERKQQARLEKPPRPRRRPGRRPAGRHPQGRSPADPEAGAQHGPKPPSPADVARHVAIHGSVATDPPGPRAGTPETAPENAPVVPTLAGLAGATPALSVPPRPPALTGAPSPYEPRATDTADTTAGSRDLDAADGADPEHDVALADAGHEADAAPAPDDEAYAAHDEGAPDRPDENQLALEL